MKDYVVVYLVIYEETISKFQQIIKDTKPFGLFLLCCKKLEKYNHQFKAKLFNNAIIV